MIRLVALLGLLGLAAMTAIVAWSGYAQVLAALEKAGWGIVWTTFFHIVPLTFCVIGWQVLMPGRKKPSILFMLYVLWLRASVNHLLPVARIGGELVSVRVMMKHGMRKTTAVASTIVELTLSILAVFVVSVAGVLLFALRVADQDIIWKLLVGLLLSLPIVGVMVLVQRIGFFGVLDKIFTLMIRDKWKDFIGNTKALDRAVHAVYRRKRKILIGFLWQIASWVSGAGEIVLALYFLGHPLPWVEAFMIEALIQASISAAFVVPGALGVQEGGFLLFGHLLGLSPDIAVALAVIRRCSDVLLYIPGLIVWQIQEGKWLLRRHR